LLDEISTVDINVAHLRTPADQVTSQQRPLDLNPVQCCGDAGEALATAAHCFLPGDP
jgi:hypothetical protein